MNVESGMAAGQSVLELRMGSLAQHRVPLDKDVPTGPWLGSGQPGKSLSHTSPILRGHTGSERPCQNNTGCCFCNLWNRGV